MSRKRVIYQSEALYVGGTGLTAGTTLPQHTATQLDRVQSANYSFDIARTDVNQFGQLARIDSLILEQPTVSLDFTYYPGSGEQETLMGFNLHASNPALGHILSGTRDVLNYYIVTSAEGADHNLDTDASEMKSVIGLGNMSLTSYSIDGAVGDFVSASVNAEGLNMVIDSSGISASSNQIAPSNPAVTITDGNSVGGTVIIPAGSTGSAAGVSALQPKDVSISLTSLGNAALGISATDLKIQSFSFGLDLGRTPLEKLGSRFAFSREIDFPVTATLDFSANIGDMSSKVDVGNASVESIVEDDSAEYDLSVCVKPSNGYGMEWALLGAKMDSQSFSSSIGDNKSVDMSFSTQVGSAADTSHGVRISVRTTACANASS